MENPDIATATTVLGWLTLLRNVGAVAVILGVTAEFAGDWFARPYEDKIASVRAGEISRLNNETERLRNENLKLQERLSPRSLKEDIFIKALEGQPRATVKVWYASDDGDSYWLALDIAEALKNARWVVSETVALPRGETYLFDAGKRAHAAFGKKAGWSDDLIARVAAMGPNNIFLERGRFTGVWTVSNVVSNNSERPGPHGVLQKALHAAISATTSGQMTDPALPDGTVVILIEPKP